MRAISDFSRVIILRMKVALGTSSTPQRGRHLIRLRQDEQSTPRCRHINDHYNTRLHLNHDSQSALHGVVNSGTKCNLILVSGTANQSRHEQHEVDLSVRRLLSSA